MADLPDWLIALLGNQQNNPNAQGPSPSAGLLQMQPQTGGILAPPRPVPIDTGMDSASDPNTPIRTAGITPLQQGRSVDAPVADTTPTAGTNVVGTPASGATEASSPGFLNKAGQFLGSLYGQGGPGDSLIALGAGIASPEGWAKGVSGAMKTQSDAALNNAKMQAFKLQVQQAQLTQNQTYNYFKSKGLSNEEAMAATVNPDLQKAKIAELAGADKYGVTKDQAGNPIYYDQRDPTKSGPLGNPNNPPQPLFKPVNDPTERAALGVSPDDKRPIEKNTATGQWQYKNPETAENAESQGLGKGRSDVVSATMKAGQGASKVIQDLDIINDAMKAGGNKISTGPFAKEALSVKQAVKNLTGYDLGATPETEVASKTGFALASAASRAINQRGGTQAEFLKALQNVPGIFLSPEGNQAMISILKQQAQHEQELGKMAYDHRPGENFIQKETDFYNSHPIISPFTGKPMGQEDAVLLTRKADPTGASMSGGSDIGPQAQPVPRKRIWSVDE